MGGLCHCIDEKSKEMHISQIILSGGNHLNVLLHGKCKQWRATRSEFGLGVRYTTVYHTEHCIQMQCDVLEAMLRATLQHGMEPWHCSVECSGVAVNGLWLSRWIDTLYLIVCEALLKMNQTIRFVCEQCENVVTVMFPLFSHSHVHQWWQEEISAQVRCKNWFWLEFVFVIRSQGGASRKVSLFLIAW